MAKATRKPDIPEEDRPLSAVQQKFQLTQQELDAKLIERSEEITLCLTALVARANPLFVGPPGTGKSLLADSIAKFINGKVFSVLITKFTVPEELFGPPSLQALQNDEFRRITTGRFPDSDVAFLDEIFKGSSAILNTLLKGLNERKFENGGRVLDIPLQMAIAASNEFPDFAGDGKELAALFDRFLIRKIVRPVSTVAGRKRLLWEDNHIPELTSTVTAADLDVARAEAKKLPWSPEGMDCLERIIHALRKEGVEVGDRRQYLSVQVARAYAYLEGASRVQPEHLEVLAHTLWTDPVEHPKKAHEIVAKIANPVGAQLTQMLAEAEQISSETDPKEMAKAVASAKKLEEIGHKLSSLKPSVKQKQAVEYVINLMKQLQLATLTAAGMKANI